jgi:hypothetical protein
MAKVMWNAFSKMRQSKIMTSLGLLLTLWSPPLLVLMKQAVLVGIGVGGRGPTLCISSCS